MKRSNLTQLVLLGFLAGSVLCFGQDTFVTTIKLFPSPKQILQKLPKAAKLKLVGPVTQGSQLTGLTTTLPPPLLKECGFRSLSQESLGSARNPTTVQIYEMGDTSGAFSLYTLQNRAGTKPEELGDQAFIIPGHLWMWQANLVVHASTASTDSAAQSRLLALAHEISILVHQRAELPNLVKEMPSRGQIAGSLQYILGPEGFSNLDLQVNPWKLGLEMGAEATTANYLLGENRGKLLLISYPTPQMARRYFAGIQDSRDLLRNPTADEKVFTKRAGPMIAILYGNTDTVESGKMLEMIQYTANLTWDQVPPDEELRAYLRTIVRSVMLTVALLLITLGVGVLWGLIRMGVKRWAPIQIFDRPEDVELVELHLSSRDQPSKNPPSHP